MAVGDEPGGRWWRGGWFFALSAVVLWSIAALLVWWAAIPFCAAPFLLAGYFVTTGYRRRREAARIHDQLCAWCAYPLAGLARTPTVRDGVELTLITCSECGRWNAAPMARITVAGMLAPPPSPAQLGAILRAAGLTPKVRNDTVEVEVGGTWFHWFPGSDKPSLVMGVDPRPFKAAVVHVRRVSDILARADVRHSIKVWERGDDGAMLEYLHHRWPR